MSTGVVPLHPEVQADPSVVRWVLTGRTDSLAHLARSRTGALGMLVQEGVLVGLTGGIGWIETTLAPGRSWSDAAGLVRDAVTADVAGAPPQGTAPGDLAELAEAVLAAEVAPLAGAHGGRIEIDHVEEHTVAVVLDGACHGCPAAKTTLQDRFEGALRQWDPQATVVETPGSAAQTRASRSRGGSWLPFPRVRGRDGTRS